MSMVTAQHVEYVTFDDEEFDAFGMNENGELTPTRVPSDPVCSQSRDDEEDKDATQQEQEFRRQNLGETKNAMEIERGLTRERVRVLEIGEDAMIAGELEEMMYDLKEAVVSYITGKVGRERDCADDDGWRILQESEGGYRDSSTPLDPQTSNSRENASLTASSRSKSAIEFRSRPSTRTHTPLVICPLSLTPPRL